MKAIGSLFGGDTGPSDAELKAQRMAEKNEMELEKKRKEEQEAKDSQLRLLRGLQGRGGSATTFQETGTRGLAEKLG